MQQQQIIKPQIVLLEILNCNWFDIFYQKRPVFLCASFSAPQKMYHKKILMKIFMIIKIHPITRRSREMLKQHCRHSICSYFGWLWQTLNLRRALLSKQTWHSWEASNFGFSSNYIPEQRSWECGSHLISVLWLVRQSW